MALKGILKSFCAIVLFCLILLPISPALLQLCQIDTPDDPNAHVVDEVKSKIAANYNGAHVNKTSQLTNLSIVLVMDKSTLGPGDVLHISVQIINTGSEDAHFDWFTGGQDFDLEGTAHFDFSRMGFIIEGPNGIVFQKSSLYPITLGIDSLTLEPNKTNFFNYTWDLSCSTRLFHQPAGIHSVKISMSEIDGFIAQGSVNVNFDRYYWTDVSNTIIFFSAVIILVVAIVLIRKRYRRIKEKERVEFLKSDDS